MQKSKWLTLLFFIINHFTPLYSQTDTLLVVTYSLSNFPSESSGNLTPYFTKIFSDIRPDVIAFQQITKENGCNILEASLEAGTRNNYQTAQFIDGNDSDNALMFRPERVTLNSQKQIKTTLRDISRYELSLMSNPRDNPFYVYSLHLKAGTSLDDQSKRRAEMQLLENDILTLSQGSNYLICGDFNSQKSSDSAFVDFISFSKNENYDVYDPIFAQGTWHNNSLFSDFHTQSTHEQSTGYFASGGMDDRFDIIFMSKEILKPPGYFYIDSSYLAYGQDGRHFNKSINDSMNYAVQDSIADALFYSSDHLPVMLKIGFNPEVSGVELVNVYITDSGTKYHNYDCRYLNSSKHSVSLDWACSNGYSPCSVCTPPSCSSSYCNNPKDELYRSFYLSQNYPNPFNSETLIQYKIPKQSNTRLEIYNNIGELVRVLMDENQSAGYYTIPWNGLNTSGNAVPSGIYLYTLKTKEFIQSRKLLLVR